MPKSSREREEGWPDRGDEYLNNEKLKDQYADNCLPLWNKFLSDVQNIARNMSTDSPKKYSSALDFSITRGDFWGS